MMREGSEVKWKWGNGYAKGKVKESYTEKVSKTIQGTEVVRKGESGNKALYISVEDGTHALKLESEVERV